MESRKKNWMILGIIFAGICLGIYLFFCSKSEGKSQETAFSGPHAVEVSVLSVQEKEIQPRRELPGRIDSFRMAEVRPQINGIVQKRLFTEGTDVKAGDVLYRIDPDLYKATLQSARASLARANALEYAARLKAERYRKLVKTNAVSIQEQTEIEAAWKQSQAEVLAAEAAVRTAKINLNYTQIKAPISGRIGKSLVSEGALVTAQQPMPLTAIQQLDPVYVDLTQSADEVLRLKAKLKEHNIEKTESDVDTLVHVLLPDGTEHAHTGSLAFSDVTVDSSTGSIVLRSVIPNPDQMLLPGMFVRARLTTSHKRLVPMVPLAAVMRNNKGQTYVMVVTPESLVEVRMVDPGTEIGSEMIIEKGLSPGEQIVVEGLQKILPGMTVKAVPFSSETSSEQ